MLSIGYWARLRIVPSSQGGSTEVQQGEYYDDQAYDQQYDANGQYYDANGQYYGDNGQYYAQDGEAATEQQVYYDENGQPYYADEQYADEQYTQGEYAEDGQYEYEYDEAAYAAAYGNPADDVEAELEALRQQNEILRQRAAQSAATLHPMDKAALAQEFEQLAYEAEVVGEQVAIPTTLLEEQVLCGNIWWLKQPQTHIVRVVC